MQELQGSYDLGIVILSVIIAIIGFYISIDILQHMLRTHKEMKRIWLSIGAITMGLSIWSMHFIGMMAFNLRAQVYYDWAASYLSILPALVATFVTFILLGQEKVKPLRFIFSSMVMSIGLITMHYVGIASLDMPEVVMEMNLTYIWLTIGLAIFTSSLTIFIMKKMKTSVSILFKIVTACIIGTSITSVHYIGMEAMQFYVPMDYAFFPSMLGDKMFLALSTSTIMTFVLVAVILIGRIENRNTVHLAYHDILTGLANRRSFLKQYNIFLKRARKQTTALTCILFDVDHFKWINDTFGYDIGDKFLQQMANKIKEFERPDINVARLDGNRFGILIKSRKAISNVDPILKRIQREFEQINFSYGQFQFKPTLSIGASSQVFSDKVHDNLFFHAEQALHYAKQHGKNNFQIYNEKVHSNKREMKMITCLQKAIEKDEFILHYQPIVGSGGVDPTKAEVLIRWESEELGPVSPAEFIPIAEKNGLIVEISEWVMKTAFKQIKDWEKQGFIIQTLSINVSPVNFQYGNLDTLLHHLTNEFQLDASKIELEITETSVMKNIDEAVQTLERLRDQGFSIALDDFGTGLSSLNYLQQLPIDTLKIDRSFVENIEKDKTKIAIVDTIIQLANHLGIQVTVEGVETEEQSQLLQSLGCHHLQGYHFSKPMPYDVLQKEFITGVYPD